jgi:ribonuclease P protein component
MEPTPIYEINMDSRYTFRRQQRLLKPYEFQHVFEQASKSNDTYFSVLARRNTLTFARLGLAIAKKRVKRAVVRNRLKRLIRESFRLQQQELAGLDCVILAQDGANQATNQTLLHSLTNHWQRTLRRCQATNIAKL